MSQSLVLGAYCPYCSASIPRGRAQHCPECLKTVHGKRKDGFHCGGCLEPVAVEFPDDKCIIHYQCNECGVKTRHKNAVQDKFETIVSISARSYCSGVAA